MSKPAPVKVFWIKFCTTVKDKVDYLLQRVIGNDAISQAESSSAKRI